MLHTKKQRRHISCWFKFGILINTPTKKNLQDKATEKFKELQNAWNEIDTYFKSGVARNEASRKNTERTNDNQENMRKEAAQSPEDEKQQEFNIIMCMRCTTKNRVPLGKEANAKCGNCGNPLISSEIKTVRRKALSINFNYSVNCPYCSDEFPVPQWGDLSITCPKCHLKYKVQ